MRNDNGIGEQLNELDRYINQENLSITQLIDESDNTTLLNTISNLATEFFNTTDYADFVEELLDFIDPDVHDEMEAILYKDSDQQGDLQYDIYDLLK